MQATVQDILRSRFSAFQAGTIIPERMSRAANAMVACRSAMLGGHVERCPAGHFAKIHYNSCRHRSCPQCRFLRVEHWLEVQRARFIDCPHHHVIFTIPAALNGLWRHNQRALTNLLFEVASDVLLTLLADERHMGARPGITATLHTWGQSLQLHPPLHCIVTAGGLDDDGDWRTPKRRVLLPGRVVRELFQGRFLGRLERMLRDGDLKLPGGMDDEGALGLMAHLWAKRWNVQVMERYAHADGVLNYLGRYVRGGPIGNSRILAFDGDTVSFAYTDNRERDAGKRHKVMKLEVFEFIRRLLEHVPPVGMRVVRSYGLYANGARRHALTRARRCLAQPPPAEPAKASIDRLVVKLSLPDPRSCPQCGRKLVVVGELPRDDHGRRRRQLRVRMAS